MAEGRSLIAYLRALLRRCPCGNRSSATYTHRWCAECGPYVAEESR